MRFTFFIILMTILNSFSATITVDPTVGKKTISPFIYGRNNSLSDSKSSPTSQVNWQKYKDAGIRIFRENGGNNSTKYNWEKKLSSHPDWYNNVYAHDWDYTATTLQENYPGAQGVWALQLTGWAASSTQHNFGDWNYNRSQWWEGVHNNWAGGGGPDEGDGNPELYLEEWSADQTTDILDHWFSDLGLDASTIKYWNMDNEPEVWNGTHDDVFPENISADEYLEKYIAVAKAARAKYPDIKLMGPVSTNEWQWYNWNNDKVSEGGKSYVWLEYFIKKIAEEQDKSGIRLLDVVDLHFYPGESSATDIVQLHRVWFDEEYRYPGANGVKRAGIGGWSDSIRQEYIFGRINEWLIKYMGENHGVGLGVTEMGIQGNDPNVTAVWYVSTMGTFADNSVELFIPWTWKTGMWEALHLMSRYSKPIRVQSVSDEEDMISAYSSTNAVGDSLTLFIVNREVSAKKSTTIELKNFMSNGSHDYLLLSDLPNSETFKSHQDNALQSGSVSVTENKVELSLPAMSVMCIQLAGKTDNSNVEHVPVAHQLSVDVYPNPFNPSTTIAFTLQKASSVTINVYDVNGRLAQNLQNGNYAAGDHRVQLNAAHLPSGVYVVSVQTNEHRVSKKVMLLK